MNALKMGLALVLGLAASHVSASIVASNDVVVESNLDSMDGSPYSEGYVQLNKTAHTISLVLQPVMPACAAGRMCAQVMPATNDYYFQQVGSSVDSCNAVTYTAEQNLGNPIKVLVTDNSNYDYRNCPTLAPIAATVVQIEQVIPLANGDVHIDALFLGEGFTAIRF